MALTGTGDAWGNAVADAILALNPDSGDLSSGEEASVRSFWKAICGEHVDHIVSNTTVVPGTFTAGGDPVTGAGDLS